ncbi:MAG: four helix bundle protein [Candidatus Omnitrophota bacterium]
MGPNKEKKPVKTYRDLNVYKQSFEMAFQVFCATKEFPAEERYGLTDQVRRAARSIPTNIAEGWAKRKYENVFKRHLLDSVGSCEEVKVWLEMAHRCGYLDKARCADLLLSYAEIGSMLSSLLERWKSYS